MFRIVWQDGSSAKYNNIDEFLSRIKAEAQASAQDEFIVVIDA